MKIKTTYKVKSEEASLDICGYSFLCIYGTHINGNYIAMPNWGVATELSDANDIFYNKNAIKIMLESRSELADILDRIGEDIAKAISVRLEKLEGDILI